MRKNILSILLFIVISFAVTGCAISPPSEFHGHYNHSLGNYSDSVYYYERVISVEPHNKTVLLMLGWSYFWLERYEDAMFTFERLRKLDEESLDALEGIGWTAFKLGKYKESLNAFQTFLQREKNHVGAIEGIAYNYFKLGNLKKAKEYLGIALVKNPKSFDNHLIRGWVAYMESDFPTAVKFFKNALRYSKKSKKEDVIDTYAVLGNAYYGDKNYNMADYYYYQALEKEPEHQGALTGKQQLLAIKRAVMAEGAKLFAAGDYDDALVEYGEVEKLYPEWSEVYAAKGWALYRKDNYRGAYKEFKKGLKHYKLSYDLYDGVGWSSIKLGKRKEAEKSFKKALEILPGYYSSWAGLKELEGPAEKKE